MNKKLKVALARRSSEQGFALPIALGLGFVMLLIGATMIMRSQSDQVTASAQKSTAQSLATNEGGIARTLSKLNQFYPHLLRLNYDPINTATSKTHLGPDGIPNSGDEGTTAVDQWSSPPNPPPCTPTGSLPSGLVSGSVGSGSYQIKAYRYRDPDGIPNNGDEKGNLLIEGQQGSAVSQLQVSMPIIRSTVAAAGSFPGLYSSNSISLGNNDVLRVTGSTGSAANVICRDCTVPSAQCVNGVPTPEGLNSAVGRGPNSVIDGNIIIGDPQLPPVPTAPATTCSATSGVNCSNNIGSISGDITLPRPTDVTNRTTWGVAANEPYHYVISSISLSGNDVITVNTTTAPVYLYVSGNVSFGGNAVIAHTGDSGRLRLYGNPADPTNSITDQSITLSGGASTTNIFIYVPDATVSINGGSSDPDIQGAVWAKTWNGSSSNNAEIRVPDNMPSLLGASFSVVGVQPLRSGPPNTWQRQSITQ